MNDQQGRAGIKTRVDRLPEELRDPPVALAAASFIGPLFLVLLGLIAGQTEASSPLYTAAAVVFVLALGGFIVTSVRRFFVRRAENEQLEEERIRRRIARRPSASTRRAPAQPEVARSDARRAS
jgi:undecaprenyl pyrophosphate phosphatase UppP